MTAGPEYMQVKENVPTESFVFFLWKANTWNKSCNVSETKQRQRSEYTFAWSGSCTGLSQNFNIGQIKLSLSMKANNCLLFTTPYKETRGTFVPLNVMFVLKNLKGWNSAFEEDMPWRPPIKHMRAKTGDHKHAVRSCCHSRIAREVGERFQLIDKLTFILFWHFIKPRVGGRGP